VADTTVLLIEPDPKTAGFIRHMLASAGHRLLHSTGGKEGLIQAWRDQPDAIILEMALPDLDGLELVRRLRRDRRTAQKPIYALTSRSAPEDVKAGLEAGVTEYLLKQPDAVELLLRHLAGVQAPVPADRPLSRAAGRLVVFLSANGGSGTSSLCLNIAHEFVRSHPETRLAAIDLVLPLGSLAYLTGSEPRTDLVRLTRLSPQELNPESLRRLLPSPRAWDIQLIPGASDPTQASALRTESLGPLIQAVRAAFDYVFIDIGRNLSPMAMLALAQAELINIVFTPEPVAIGNTRALISYLKAEDIPADRLFLISNLPRRLPGMGVDEVERDLGHKVDGSIHHLDESLSRASALHIPLSVRFAEESGTQSLRQTAIRLLTRLEAGSPAS
jgi:CheY-like chemotaxis protein